MSKLEKAFQNKKAFIPFITCGDPDLATTKKLIFALIEAGADVIELGIPFSDPTAEGPVIQAANERALKNGVTTDSIFAMLEEIKNDINIPLVFMTYANVLFSYGIETFVQKAKALGIAGIILPDVPFEEKEEFSTVCESYDIDYISLVAPNSAQRSKTIAEHAKGFLYCVSSLGVTGTRTSFESSLGDSIKELKQHTSIPCAIGFGISSPEQAAAMAKLSDGVIVGSAIVKLCEKHGTDSPQHVKAFVSAMTKALH